MEHTDGLGKTAEVWVEGNLLCVCDGFSSKENRCPPGPLENVKFSYVSNQRTSWAEAVTGNRTDRKLLEPVRGFSYTGYGQIVQVMPVVIDFGLVQMEDANWSSDEGLIGCYVRVPIDRLEISCAVENDWPKDMR